MRLQKLLFLFSIITLCFACGGETSVGTTTDSETSSPENKVSTDTSNNANSIDLPASHDCTLSNEVIEGNQFWIREKGILVAITADSTTLDAELGASHRVLEVYNTENCEQIHREVLPVNVSPDFPYYLAEITYNTDSELVGIRGANTIYVYDVANKKLLPKLEPQFLSARMSEDAQSGTILRLEVWEDYLIGFAEDKGTFAFNLSDANAPEAVLPVAEFKTNENEYSPLFAFVSNDGKVQLIMPAYDQDEDQFTINTLFNSPESLNLSIAASARNNRFIVLRKTDADRTAVAIDMQNRKLLNLPSDVATQATQAILTWARQQE